MIGLNMVATGRIAMTKPEMTESVRSAAAFLKGLANETRLLILCHLAEGEMSVTELELEVGIRQPTLSQQLARLRAENLVTTRRQARSIYYSLASSEARRMIALLYEIYCAPEKIAIDAPAGERAANAGQAFRIAPLPVAAASQSEDRGEGQGGRHPTSAAGRPPEPPAGRRSNDRPTGRHRSR
jgi:ArsR family transcriptional regulator